MQEVASDRDRPDPCTAVASSYTVIAIRRKLLLLAISRAGVLERLMAMINSAIRAHFAHFCVIKKSAVRSYRIARKESVERCFRTKSLTFAR